MQINRDYFQRITPPVLSLCNGNHDKLFVIYPLTYEYVKNFADLNQVNFSVPYMLDGEETYGYDKIDVMHFVEVDQLDFFMITSVNIKNEGTENEIKEVTATSCECTLGQKYISEFYINQGETGSVNGVRLFNMADKAHSLLHLALDTAPEWAIEHVDPSLQSLERSFSVDKQDIYSFLMEDVATAFECFFVFDTLHQLIYVYSENNVSLDTGIYVSYNNLLKSGELSCSTDDIKTCLQLTTSDETYGSIREINGGQDKIYNFSAFATTDYWTETLVEDYNNWLSLYHSQMTTYNNLLHNKQDLYIQINDWKSNKIPSTATNRKVGYGSFSIFNSQEVETGTVSWNKYTSIQKVSSLPSSTDQNILWIVGTNMYRYSPSTGMFNVNDWKGYSLDNLNVALKSAQEQQAAAMQAGYGNESSPYYISQYYIYYATVVNIEAKIKSVNSKLESLSAQQAVIQRQMDQIADTIAIKNNFTRAELIELSQYIREDQLSSDNYVITSIMTDQERFDTLDAFMEFGQRELAKVSTPQLTFDTDLVNLFMIPEFDAYSGGFDVGNYILVSLRDDYNIKAKLLTVTIDFYDADNFSCEFGNVYRKANNVFTSIQDAINTASSAATSVSMNRSYWTESAKNTEEIDVMLQQGLLAAGTVLTDGTKSELVLDTRGLFVNSSDDSAHPNDSIYIGGGRILFTDDDWLTVSEAIGRVRINNQDVFGVLAQAMVSGYIYATNIEGGTIKGSAISGNTINGNTISGNTISGGTISSTTLTSSTINGNTITGGTITGTTINNGNGTFSVDSNGALVATNATVTGKITASSGMIGKFTITNNADLIYSSSNPNYYFALHALLGSGFFIEGGRPVTRFFGDRIVLDQHILSIGHDGEVYPNVIQVRQPVTSYSTTYVNPDDVYNPVYQRLYYYINNTTNITDLRGATEETPVSGRKYYNLHLTQDKSGLNGQIIADGKITTYDELLVLPYGLLDNSHESIINENGLRITGGDINVVSYRASEGGNITADGNINCSMLFATNYIQSSGNIEANKGSIYARWSGQQDGTGNVVAENYAAVGDLSAWNRGDLDVGHNIRYGGTCTQISDARLKTDIMSLDTIDSEHFIYSLRPVRYRYINNPDKEHHGFIAQDVERLVLSDNAVVCNNNDGYKSIAYTEIIADLVKTVQKQNERIFTLEQRIKGE